jgi:hypothetical protein
VLQLEPIKLQQCEEEGGHRRHQPSRDIAGEEDELSWLKVDEWKSATPHPLVEPRRLPAKKLPQTPEVVLHLETQKQEVGCHRYNW